MKKIGGIVLEVVVILMLTVGIVYANTTTIICDPGANPKYWCSYVGYTPNGNGWTITDRYYKGSGGNGGAQKWQLYWVKDWAYYNSTWNLLGGWGEQPWHTNQFFDQWYTISTDRSSPYYNTAVTGQHRFYTPENPPETRYWCSDKWEHYMASGNSYSVTTYARCIS